MADRDFVIRGGTVVCPASGHHGSLDVAVADGCIDAVAESIAPTAGAGVIDAEGLILTPGLIDLHVHVFAGQDLGIPAARIGLAHGSTTLVDAGSAGAHLYPAFRDGYLQRASERVLHS